MNEDFTLLIKAPGYKKNEINIEFEEGYILISAFNEKFGSSKATQVLPENIDVDNATAKLEDGILEINIPFRQKQKKMLQIQ
jgi:HSP20 family molecular chaperone IbpA